MTDTKSWPPLKMALWRVLMDEQLNDGHYIKAFHLIEKLYAAAQSAPGLAAPHPDVVQIASIIIEHVTGADPRFTQRVDQAAKHIAALTSRE